MQDVMGLAMNEYDDIKRWKNVTEARQSAVDYQVAGDIRRL